MTEQSECRWQWTKPDKVGLWWWGGDNGGNRQSHTLSALMDKDDVELVIPGWWSYIGPIPPEPLPPKRKVTQTLWMVPAWSSAAEIGPHFQRWLSPDDTIPPGAIETVQKREVEQ